MAESLTISTIVSTAPPAWITKLRKPKLRAELSDMSAKFEKKDNKCVLIELLRLRLRCEVLLSGNNFLNTDDFRRLLVTFIPGNTLMVMMVVSKPWSRVADEFISDGVASGAMMVHDGEERKEMYFDDDEEEDARFKARKVKLSLVTRVIFLLNITKVGKCACFLAANLVVVDLPEGVESISEGAFQSCHS
ncbi:hypothetical protein TL16_g02411 [Triparma laevis f. inornata]|uniref:Uncharacterized protein n=1 Tax=Triparma laevis f. inornata TaxID=1714386 RepID=A0A9W6ZW22_9STRA|nr:hypothetical protein TL16_g02411 [Triparma laevis f. inornata]